MNLLALRVVKYLFFLDLSFSKVGQIYFYLNSTEIRDRKLFILSVALCTLNKHNKSFEFKFFVLLYIIWLLFAIRFLSTKMYY